MVTVKLHHADDAPEVGNEALQYARVIQATQRVPGVLATGQHLEEKRVIRRVPHVATIDQVQALGNPLQGFGVNVEPVPLGNREYTQQILRMLFEPLQVIDRERVCETNPEVR